MSSFCLISLEVVFSAFSANKLQLFDIVC